MDDQVVFTNPAYPLGGAPLIERGVQNTARFWRRPAGARRRTGRWRRCASSSASITGAPLCPRDYDETDDLAVREMRGRVSRMQGRSGPSSEEALPRSSRQRCRMMDLIGGFHNVQQTVRKA